MTEKISTEKNDYSHNNEIPHCPHCLSKNVYGISRIVGYFSVIDNWNSSKKAEFANRQKGNYWVEESEEE